MRHFATLVVLLLVLHFMGLLGMVLQCAILALVLIVVFQILTDRPILGR